MHPGPLPRVLYIVTSQDQCVGGDGQAQGPMALRSCSKCSGVCPDKEHLSDCLVLVYWKSLFMGKKIPPVLFGCLLPVNITVWNSNPAL